MTEPDRFDPDNADPQVDDAAAAAELFDELRLRVMVIGILSGVIFGGIYTAVLANSLFSAEGGVLGAKAGIALGSGVVAGAGLSGLLIMPLLIFAPASWFHETDSGQRWLARTGLQNTTPLALRVIAVLILIPSILVTGLYGMGIVELIQKQ